jgi:hypothetical protein
MPSKISSEWAGSMDLLQRDGNRARKAETNAMRRVLRFIFRGLIGVVLDSCRIHVDRADVRNEDLDRPPQWNIQAFSVPAVVRHVQYLKQSFLTRGNASATRE